jgi:hypothetical protein
MTDDRVRRGIGCGFGGAMVAAPFLAWVWGAEAAVGVMMIALVATSYLAIDGSRTAEPEIAKRLRVLGLVNGVLAVGGLVVLIALLAG